MDGVKENKLIGYPSVISYESSKKIIEQMEKNVCKVKIGNIQGTGFFCKIPFPNKNNILPVFITNNHIINEELLNKGDKKVSILTEESNTKIITLKNRMSYTNKEYDITIIEIIDDDEIKQYLQLDDNVIDDIINSNDKNDKLIDETIYIIQYADGKLSVSYGVMHSVSENKKYNFNHKCSTKDGSSGSPVLNANNNKIIGIHKEGHKNNGYNSGTFLNYPIKEFIKKNLNNIKTEVKKMNKISSKESDKIAEIKLKNIKEENNNIYKYHKPYIKKNTNKSIKFWSNKNLIQKDSSFNKNKGINELNICNRILKPKKVMMGLHNEIITEKPSLQKIIKMKELPNGANVGLLEEYRVKLDSFLFYFSDYCIKYYLNIWKHFMKKLYNYYHNEFKMKDNANNRNKEKNIKILFNKNKKHFDFTYNNYYIASHSSRNEKDGLIYRNNSEKKNTHYKKIKEE